MVSVTWFLPGLSDFQLLLATFNHFVKPGITPSSYSYLDIVFPKDFTSVCCVWCSHLSLESHFSLTLTFYLSSFSLSLAQLWFMFHFHYIPFLVPDSLTFHVSPTFPFCCLISASPFVIVEPTLQSWFHCWFVCRFPLVLNCVKYIFVSIEMITFFFILLTCCIVLTDFLMLNQPCISLINLIYPWHCEFLYLIWQYFVKSVVSVQNEFFGSCSDLV